MATEEGRPLGFDGIAVEETEAGDFNVEFTPSPAASGEHKRNLGTKDSVSEEIGLLEHGSNSDLLESSKRDLVSFLYFHNKNSHLKFWVWQNISNALLHLANQQSTSSSNTAS